MSIRAEIKTLSKQERINLAGAAVLIPSLIAAAALAGFGFAGGTHAERGVILAQGSESGDVLVPPVVYSDTNTQEAWDESAVSAEPATTQEEQAQVLDQAGDTDVIGEVQEVAPAPVVEVDQPVTQPELIQEDDPRWDCRTMGNRACGVEIQGAWYVVQFDDAGLPESIVLRGQGGEQR